METNWIEVADVILRAFVSLITLFLITKLLGKKQVSQLSLFDYVIGISIGNFAAEMTINVDSQFMNGIVAVIVFGLVAYAVSIVTMKSMFLRIFFMGKPTILIQDGKLLIKGLKKVKFDINDMLEECRSNGYFDISQIAYAVMEANGKISFLPKEEYRQPTLKDLKIKTTKASLCANVIIDGKIIEPTLKSINLDKKWITNEINKKGKKIENILLATIDNQKQLNIYEKKPNEKILDILE